jgi:ribosomal protein L37AE/L43A
VTSVRARRPALGERLANWETSARASLRRAPASLGARLKESFAPLTELVFPPTGRTRVKPRKKLTRGSSSKNGFRPARKAFTRRKPSPIHLSQEEEHRCPYCLEQVVKSDPHGVHICKICHTWHHQDCWDVAGVCQVPHEYA